MNKIFDYEFFKSLAELYKDLTGIEIPGKTVAITFMPVKYSICFKVLLTFSLV